MSHASQIIQDYDGCARAYIEAAANMTDFSWLQNCATDKDDCLIDGRVFHSDGPATEKFRGPKPTVLVLGTVRSP